MGGEEQAQRPPPSPLALRVLLDASTAQLCSGSGSGRLPSASLQLTALWNYYRLPLCR